MFKIKAVHIYTDVKFIDEDINKFEGNYIHNTVVLLENNQKYSGEHSKEILLLKENNENIKKIIEICNKADIVFLYNLDLVKTYIANRITKKTKIAWRFFGDELYNRKQDLFLSDLTQKIIFSKKLDFLKSTKEKIKIFLKWKINPEIEFFKAINRVNYFLCYFESEYELLKKDFKKFPEFIKFPLDQKHKVNNFCKLKKDKVIVVGNSKNKWNNHLDIIKIIKKKNNKDYKFYLLFSYGPETQYTKKIREEIYNFPAFVLIEDFYLKNDFDIFYSKVSSFVMNSYRQHALGNIFVSIKNGVKIYLNKKNLVFNELIKDFKIFTIEDFEKDLKNNNLQLDENDVIKNQKQLNKLLEECSIEKFQENIYSRIKK
jgi:hypothetical protein